MAAMLAGMVFAGDAAAQASGHGASHAADGQARYQQVSQATAHDQRAARQPNLGGGFLELLITGRDPTPRRQAAPSQGQPRSAAAPPAARQQAAPARAAQPSRQTARQAQPAPRQAAQPAPRVAPGYRAHQDITPARVIAAQPPSGMRQRQAAPQQAAPRQASVQAPRQARQLPQAARPAPPRQSAPVASEFRRQVVSYSGPYSPGTIVVDTDKRFLYLVQPGGKAIRYGVGVGRDGFAWRGTQTVTRKAEWPDWRPPESMRRRQPELPRFMAGGPNNPLGARALYLGNTLYRIHGTNEPHTIGQAMSSGCIRMLNEDVKDLYERVRVGARVVVR